MSEKVNPIGLKRPVRAIETKTFTDSNQPGVEIVMRLRPLDALDASNAEALGKEVKTTYLDGVMDFPPIDGEAVTLNAEVIEAAAIIFYCQCGSDELRYAVEEIIAMSVTMPEVWYTLLKYINDKMETSPLGKALRIALGSSLVLSLDGASVIQN
jgi:hypothetical protein